MNRRSFFEILYGDDIEGRGIELRAIGTGPVKRKFCKGIEEAISYRCPEGYDLYVGIALRRGQKGDKNDISSVPAFWCDLDAKDFNGDTNKILERINNFEFQPTMLVNSGGGIHAYWVFKEAFEIESLEDIFYIEGHLKGIQETLGGDEGTWDLPRILRVPDTYNHKYSPRREVKVVHLEPSLRYNPGDFDDYHVDPPAESSFSDRPIPQDLALTATDKVLIQSLSKELQEIFKTGGLPDDNTGEIDRSRGLWRIGRELKRQDVSWDQFYRIMHNSDKLGKAEGREEKYYRQIWDKNSETSLGVKSEVTSILRRKGMKVFMKRRLISEIVIKDLKTRGYFVCTDRDLYYFSDQDKKLLPIEDQYFAAAIEDFYGINISEMEFKYLMGSIQTETLQRGTKADIYRFAFYDKETKELYISRFDGQAYRLDGEKIDLISNGEDGVLFLDEPYCHPFEYMPDRSKERLFTKLFVNPVNFSTGGDVTLSKNEQRLLWGVWIYSLFFESLLPTKPIVSFLGEKGSGKSSTLRWVIQLLFGPEADVLSLAKEKEDAFLSAVTNNHICIFDNCDGRINWLNDHLSALATGGHITLRKLYTTNESVSYKPKVFLGLTARTPQFKRDDVVDRLLIFKVDRIEPFISENTLREERLSQRNLIWSELLENLNVIVATLKEDNEEKFTTNHRMADFAELGYRIASGQGFGEDFKNALKKTQEEQDIFLLEDEPIYLALEIWIQDKGNRGDELTAAELRAKLETVASDNSIIWPYETTTPQSSKKPISFAKKLNNIWSNLQAFFDCNKKEVGGRKKLYSFNLKSR